MCARPAAGPGGAAGRWKGRDGRFRERAPAAGRLDGSSWSSRPDRSVGGRGLVGKLHQPQVRGGGVEQPAAEGLALEAPQSEGQRRNHLQVVELHPVDDPLCRPPAQCLRAVDGPDVGPYGRLEDSEQAGNLRLCELYFAPGVAVQDDAPAIDCDRSPISNRLHTGGD